MVTKLKNNLSYIKYIRKGIQENFHSWEEYGVAVYENQLNNNFQIDYSAFIQGYADSVYKISFVNDRGLLELRMYNKRDEQIDLGYLVYNSILAFIPDQDPKWRLTLCTELIDFYIDFLKNYFNKGIC
nr:hypothetical protein [uncultured Flavobacterium sp.]